MSVLISARGLAIGYDGRVTATVPDLEIRRGDRVSIAGANGSGKTTLLKTLGRLIAPVSGTLSGVDAGPDGAVYVHPAPFLYAGSGHDNVRIAGRGNAGDVERAIDALRARDFARMNVREMSNGQRQRIALARALAAHPALLLIDEADSGLDADGRAAWEEVVTTRHDLALVRVSHVATTVTEREGLYEFADGMLGQVRVRDG